MPITKATASSVAPAAKGDLVVGSATNDAAVLGVGSNNQVLTADSSTTTGLKWAAASSGGMTLIETLTLSGASVTSSSIAGTYKYLTVFVNNFRPATDNTDLLMRYNSDSTANRYITRNTGSSQISFNTTYILLNNNCESGVSSVNFAWVNIYNYASTTQWKASMGVNYSMDGEVDNNKANLYPVYGLYNQTTAITTLQFLPSTGNFTSGSILIYGVS